MYTPILTTLIYVLNQNQDKVLMIHKNKDKNSEHYGKYNGLGGKLERNEDLISGMQRELKEEAGITALDYKLKGTINWPGFGKNGEDHFGFIFLVSEYEGEPFESCAEGDLSWVAKENILDLNLWESDQYFLPLVFDGTDKIFSGRMPYEEGMVKEAYFFK